MKVHDKLESIKLIKDLQLNSFPEQLFKKDDIYDIKKFLNEYPAEFYAIRSKEFVGYKKKILKFLKIK